MSGRGSAPNRAGARRDRRIAAACLAALGLTILYPALRLLAAAAAHWHAPAIASPEGWAALRNTVLISFASVAAAGLCGTALAAALAHYRFPGARMLGALAFLPLTLPPLVGSVAFYYLIGRDGLVTRAAEAALGLDGAALPGPWAILLIHTYSFSVFFYAMVAAALDALDRTQIEAARTLGAGPWRTFFRVTLPQLAPALAGAAMLTFMSSGASFSAPYFFGQDFPMLSVAIYEARTNYDEAAALTLTAVLAAVSLGALALFRTRGNPAARASKGAPAPIRARGARWAAGAAAWALAALLLAPHLVILWLAFIDHRAWQTEIVPLHFTLDNFAALLRDPGAFAPIRNSLWTSALATLAVAAVGLPAAYLIARRRPGGRALEAIAMLPWALPGTVIAIGLIAAFNDPWLPLYNTVWMLPLAYFVRELPLLLRVAGAAIEPFDAALLEAARTLGATPAHAIRRIALPLIAPAVCAGLAMVFANALGEFVASILLYTPANLPIAIRINMDWRADPGLAFAYSVLLTLLVAATFYTARRLTHRTLA